MSHSGLNGAKVPVQPNDGEALLEVQRLNVEYSLKTPLYQRLMGERRTVRAVSDVNISINRGEVLGIIGESGSGKSTLGRAIVGLAPITSGSVRLNGDELAGLSKRGLRAHSKKMQMVFQDPHASLNPTMTIGEAVGDPLRIHHPSMNASERRRTVLETLARVGLSPADEYFDKRPADMSGGQKQRVVIARAIILNPDLIIADEPISALDMSVRAKVLGLLGDLRNERSLSFIYITHDLASARFFCTNIAIMYLGRIVEYGPVEEVFSAPAHPYTKALLAAIPDPNPDAPLRTTPLTGEIADAANPPMGCSFHPRCPVAVAACGWETRDLQPLLDRYWTTLEVDAFMEQSALIGEITASGRDAHTAIIKGNGPRGSAEKVHSLIRQIMLKTPQERLWLGLKDLRVSEGAVELEFHDPSAVRPVQLRHSTVSCILADRERDNLVRSATGPAEASKVDE